MNLGVSEMPTTSWMVLLGAIPVLVPCLSLATSKETLVLFVNVSSHVKS